MGLAHAKKGDSEGSLDWSNSIAEVTRIYTELFDLLEDYAPAWYTEELHDRAAAGLDALKRLNAIAPGAENRS